MLDNLSCGGDRCTVVGYINRCDYYIGFFGIVY